MLLLQFILASTMHFFTLPQKDDKNIPFLILMLETMVGITENLKEWCQNGIKHI